MTAQTIRQVSESQTFPASYAQERLWFLEQLEPGTGLYNHCIGLRFERPVDSAALDLALNELTRRHETLRTGFGMEDGQVVQRVLPAVALRVEIEDLRVYPAEQIQAKVPECSRAEARRPFDLREAPLLRARLLLLSDQEQMLLLTLHHLVTDGWSAGVIFRELGLLYEAQTSEKSSALGELPIQYVDYAVWQRGWLQGEVLEQQLNYWREQLRDVSSGLELPCDKPRPAVRSYQGARQPLQIAAGITEGLRKLGQREGTTLFMTLLAAFQVLLHRYSGQEDVVVGTLAANRTRGELESLIGCFVNTLALRTKLAGDPTFQQVLQQVRQVTLEAYAHQDVPFEKLVRELKPERDLSRLPLFQVLFQLQDNPTLELGGLRMAPWGIENGTSLFDLSLELAATGAELIGHLEYNTDLFEAETIARMAANFEVLLTDIVADPQQRIGRIPLLTPAERARVLVDWNDTAVSYPKDQCLHDLFQAQVERTPDALAVVWGQKQFTYGELNRRANRLARHLRERGVTQETPVGLCLERSGWAVLGLLAILKAGGVCVALDPSYPEERISFMIANSQAKLLLTKLMLVPDLSRYGLPVIPLDTHLEEVHRIVESNLGHCSTPANLAYVFYTSGSTGQPRGVELEHGGIVNEVFWTHGAFAVGEMDRAAWISSPAFAVSRWELWPYLTAGASIHVADDVLGRSSLGLRDWITANGITIGFFIPAVAEQLCKADWPPHVSLRKMIVGGEKVNFWPPESLPFEVINSYGITEASSVRTVSVLRDGSPGKRRTPPIGRPIANTRIYILDKYLEPTPIGIQGELYIGGDGLARGYVGLPELTSERFLLDPFRPSGARMYRTGDLARYLPDGNIEFIGRSDQRVKIRGCRIELEEIEAVLREHSAIENAAVAVDDEKPGSARLVAYVVHHPDRTTTVSELRTFLAQRLPEYAVPWVYVTLQSLPVNLNGKLDRNGLPLPAALRSRLDREFVPPRNEYETVIAQIWSNVLELDTVGVEENFFVLGGHSLRAMQVIYRMREVFGVDIPIREFFQSPTIATLAERLSDLQRSNFPAARIPRVERCATESLLAKLDELDDSAVGSWFEALTLGGELDEFK